MTGFLVSLAMGVAVGIAYGLSGIRSPAPPIIALLGLLGMVVGEQAVVMAKAHFFAAPVQQSQTPDDSQPKG